MILCDRLLSFSFIARLKGQTKEMNKHAHVIFHFRVAFYFRFTTSTGAQPYDNERASQTAPRLVLKQT